MAGSFDADIAASTRVRLARNYADLPFPGRMSRVQAKKLNERVASRLGNREFTRLDMASLSPNERQVLVERHLASRELCERPEGMLLLSKDEKISIMVGEEDHLRIQCLLPGLQLEEADNLSRSVDAMLSVDGYAYDAQLGYLTACPTNVGTGMRASVMLHLVGLSSTGSMQSLLETVGKFGYTVRGFYGEGTQAAGDMVQISNQVTLGLSEEEIIRNLGEVVRSIVKKERSVREAMLTRGIRLTPAAIVTNPAGLLENFMVPYIHRISLVADELGDAVMARGVETSRPRTSYHGLRVTPLDGVVVAVAVLLAGAAVAGKVLS